LEFLGSSRICICGARTEHNRADIKTEPFFLGAYLRIVSDSKLWAFTALYMFTTINSFAEYFLPVILRDDMGTSGGKAQCLVAPPYCAAALVMVI
jgi:hypothetical protein